VTYREVKQKTG